jgi:hypothetical protein
METQQTTPAATLDAANLSLSAYRALREGKDASQPKETPAPAPVEETPAASDAVETEADDEGALEAETEINEDSKQGSKPPKKDKLTARFSELTGKIKALESELAAKTGGAGRSEAAETKPTDAPTLPPDPNDPEPAAEKYGDYVAWQKDWMKWQIRQVKRQEAAAAVSAQRAHAAKAQHETFQSRVEAAKAEHADYEAVAFHKDLPVTVVMGDAIKDSELGASILYELGKNPDEAARIAKLSPVAQVRELGKIEARLEAAKAAKADSSEEPPTKKLAISKAPAPIRPLGSGAATSSKPNLETMSLREYRALRESGKLR